MIQVVQKKVESAEDVVDVVNNVSINYEYFKDYQLISVGGESNLLLNFEMPEVLDSLQLAILRVEKDSGDIFRFNIHNYDFVNNYDFKYIGDNTPHFGFIKVDKFDNAVTICFGWNKSTFMDAVTITYNNEWNEFRVSLKDFNMKFGREIDRYIERKTVVNKIDYRMIMDHLKIVTTKMGYLFNRNSIEKLQRHMIVLSDKLNNKEL